MNQQMVVPGQFVSCPGNAQLGALFMAFYAFHRPHQTALSLELVFPILLVELSI